MNFIQCKRHAFVLRIGVALVLFAFTLLPGTVPVAHANTITVNSSLDTSGNISICTLRDAITAANTNSAAGGCPAGSPYPAMDTINIVFTSFYCLEHPCTIILSSPLPAVSEDVTIQGVQGVGLRTPTISGANLYRAFDLQGVNVNISNMFIVNGNATGPCPGCYGGAINTSDTTLQVSNVAFVGNHASTRGGAIYQPSGTVVINNSRFENNTVDAYGGAIDQTNGLLIVTNSTLSGNSAADGGGIEIQGSSETRLTNLTISGNNARGNGGGISRIGTTNLVSLNNVTLSNNTADSDNNGFGGGGGIYRAGGTVVVLNTIIAGNYDTPGNSGGGTIHPDCSWAAGGSLTSFGYNLLGRNDGCAISTNTGDKVGTAANPIDPRLAPLAFNGGSTPTHALFSNSPAIDAGNPLTPGGGGFGACAPTDQRGVARPLGTQCDMGAYETLIHLTYLPLIFK